MRSSASSLTTAAARHACGRMIADMSVTSLLGALDVLDRDELGNGPILVAN
jgi:hypothetical protein